MSEPQAAALQTAAPNVWHMYRAMVGIGILCGLLIVGVYELTRPIIAANKAEYLQQSIFKVLPDATASKTFRVSEDEGFELLQGEAVTGEPLVYAGYDDGGGLVGLALEASGMGYQDVIRVLYGYSYDNDAIIGIRVLDSKETPGLGDKIETDPAFVENFVRLDVSLTADGSAIANPIVAVKNGEKENAWEIDGITGATISSVAIANLLNKNTSYWVPRLRDNLDDFRNVE
jgi:electron transport complex protein RnfG